MADEMSQLIHAARQLMETERLFEADFMPAKRNPFPPLKKNAAATPAGSPATSGARPQAAAAKSAVPVDTRPASTLTRQERIDALAQLVDEVRQCKCCGLCSTATQIVFGETNPEAGLVFVGEAPGEEEDRTGRPFVGRAGELLNKIIAAMGLTRDDVYICNILKCRPPGNRAPAPEEALACRKYLVRQLEIIHPKVIVTLGNPATQNLLDTSVGITKLRGHWQQLPPIGEGLGGTPVMPTFHPAYVLRNYTEETRGLVWSDMQQVMEALGLKKKK